METKEKKPKVKKDTWEYKDRNYFLLENKQPLTYTLPSRHSRRYPLVWFDKAKGYERELRYATNQQSIFVDEQEGNVTLAHIVFQKGHLMVPKEKRNLQEFLLHHPHRNLVFKEHDKIAVAEDKLVSLELEIEALNVARELEVDALEAILRVEVGSEVSNMNSKELKRDILLFAKSNPKMFLALVEDENIHLRNVAIKALEQKIIKYDAKVKVFKWSTNNKKLLTVPFDENPFSAMAAWFKTDEGMEVLSSIEKKLL